jgi:release factor glutamine methyltransferase
VATSSEAERAGEAWTIRRVIAWASDDLKKRGLSSPRLDVELLLGLVLKMTRVQLIIDADRPLAQEELDRYKALHKRRRAGEPVAYLTGVREFYGRPFRVDARVLVPRPDTEILVETALARTRHVSLSARVLDLCTGSGCVAISLGRERPTTRVLAVDISPGALTLAQENALRLGAVNVGFLLGDLFAPLGASGRTARARFDLITANPPYIPDEEIPTLQQDVRDFEPKLALAGGPDGLDIVRRIIAEAPAHLEEGGCLAIEVAFGQAPAARDLFEGRGFRSIEIARDLGGVERVVSGIFGGA